MIASSLIGIVAIAAISSLCTAQPQVITSTTAASLTSLLNTWFAPGGAGNTYIKAFNGIIVARLGFGITSAWFEALAPYQQNTVGLRATIPKVTSGNTNQNKEISALYATRAVLNSLIVTSGFTADLDTFLTAKLAVLGVTANFAVDTLSVDTTTAIGIGNVAGTAVATFLVNDGANQLGKLGGHAAFLQRYRDYTNYVPINPGGTIVDIRFWQPLLADDSVGNFNYQVHVVPQLSAVPGISIQSDLVNVLSPGSTARKSTLANFLANVKPLADAVIAAQAGLTDQQKVIAELFNDKTRSFLPAIAYLINVPLNGQPLTIDQFIVAAFTGTLAAWDAAIIGFKNKIYWNSVRPVTAIKYIYGTNPITTWVANKGATSIPGIDFKSYIGTPAHTDYPSTSTIYFSGFGNALKAYFGGDAFGFSYTYPAGSSAVEPGLTPASSITITASTFTSYLTYGGQARFLAGVHFQEDVDDAWRITAITGPLTNKFVQSLLTGKNTGPVVPTGLTPATTPALPADDPTIAKTSSSSSTSFFDPIGGGAVAVIVAIAFVGTLLLVALILFLLSYNFTFVKKSPKANLTSVNPKPADGEVL